MVSARTQNKGHSANAGGGERKWDGILKIFKKEGRDFLFCFESVSEVQKTDLPIPVRAVCESGISRWSSPFRK